MIIKKFKREYARLRQWRRELSYSFQYESPVRISPKTRLSKNSFVGRYSYMGEGLVFGDVRIGRYCSIAHGLAILAGTHDMEKVSTHPFCRNNNLYGWIKEYRDIDNKNTPLSSSPANERTPLVIGNDVWIGNRASILDRVKSIGNGAVIGAGSIVTKDVPPYAIVAGNPAKLLRYRFSPEQIQELEELKWWDYPLPSIKHLEFDDVDRCISSLKALAQTAAKNLSGK